MPRYITRSCVLTLMVTLGCATPESTNSDERLGGPDDDLVAIRYIEPSVHGPHEQTERGYVQIDDSGYVRIELDGVHVTAQELQYSDRQRAKQLESSDIPTYAWLRHRPASLRAFMRAAADQDSSVWWYEGHSGAFATHDAADPFPNNGAIDMLTNIDAGKTDVRVAVDWLTRGLDLDLCVSDPLGVTVACSASVDQPFELISFDPTISGTYRIRVTRFSNTDRSAKFDMSLVVDSN
jgi:hypothetical protein